MNKSSTENKTTLGLKLPTDPRWVNLAEMSLEEILTDHAFCEQKAASTIISIIQLHPDKTVLVEELSPIVTEEWGHFRQVLAELKKRNLKLGFQRPDEYVKQLMKGRRDQHDKKLKFLDQLLVSALIEARSCERFKLLSEQLEDPDLKVFYHKFMVAEASHYKLFLQLARLYFDNELVEKKWNYWLNYEADIMNKLSARGDRMH